MNTHSYFDHSATTAILDAALEEMHKINLTHYGNPNSVHLLGRLAHDKLDEYQGKLSKIFKVPPTHIIFTSGGTESNNLAIWGALGGLIQGHEWLKEERDSQIITSTIEHDATKNTFRAFEEMGANVKWLPVDKDGRIQAEKLDEFLNTRTKLLSIHHVQNEIGTIQDLASISKLVRAKQPQALIHIDAVQSFLKVPFDFESTGVDLISISAHKIRGPKGIGALILGPRFESRKPKLYPLIQGSAQQYGIRPGTIALPLIAGMTKAIEWGYENFSKNTSLTKSLSEHLISKLPSNIQLNSSSKYRAPHIVNFSVSNFPSGMMVECLSSMGIFVSAGSACHSANSDPNPIITSLGYDKNRALTAMRVSIAPTNTTDEIDHLLNSIQNVIKKYSS